jgi:hypothetical protein
MHFQRLVLLVRCASANPFLQIRFKSAPHQFAASCYNNSTFISVMGKDNLEVYNVLERHVEP